MPKNLPRFKDSPTDLLPTHMEYLEAWLQWWEMREETASDLADDLDVVEANESYDASLVTGFDANPSEGEIRLLSHVITGETHRPIYVVVVAAWPESEFLVTPFAGAPVPSTPGEICTGLDDFRFGIAATWNARILPQEILESSWVVDELERDLVDLLFRHYRALIRGFEFDADIMPHTGPPILRSGDPRWTYLREEDDLLANLHAKCLTSLEQFLEPEGLLAAKDVDPDRPLLSRRYHLENYPDVFILVSEAVDPSMLAVEVLKDPSGVLLDSVIKDRAGALLGRIEQGLAYILGPEDGQIIIVSRDGTTLDLKKISCD